VVATCLELMSNVRGGDKGVALEVLELLAELLQLAALLLEALLVELLQLAALLLEALLLLYLSVVTGL
jgi:hypothetical protein